MKVCVVFSASFSMCPCVNVYFVTVIILCIISGRVLLPLYIISYINAAFLTENSSQIRGSVGSGEPGQRLWFLSLFYFPVQPKQPRVTYRDRLLHVSSVEHGMIDVQDDPVKQSTVQRLGHGVSCCGGL